MPTTTPTRETIATRRAEFSRRRENLIARRPDVALRAAGGDQAAIEEARDLAAELADLTAQLADLDVADAEARRRLDAARASDAARHRQERTAEAARVRATLIEELVAADAIIGQGLADALSRVMTMSRAADHARIAAGQQPIMAPIIRKRLIERVCGVLWDTTHFRPMGSPTPLAADDVPA